jgi:hypothetical protein
MKIKLILSSLISINCYALSIAPTISTLGAGIEAKQQIIGDLSIKISANKLAISVPYDTNLALDLNSYGLLLNYNIWRNISIDAGVYKISGSQFQDLNVDAQIVQGKYILAQGNVTQHQQTTIDSVTPYLGLSYTSNKDKGFYFGSNIGVMLVPTHMANKATIEGSAMGRRETISIPEAHQDKNIFYPVVGIQVGYNF